LYGALGPPDATGPELLRSELTVSWAGLGTVVVAELVIGVVGLISPGIGNPRPSVPSASGIPAVAPHADNSKPQVNANAAISRARAGRTVPVITVFRRPPESLTVYPCSSARHVARSGEQCTNSIIHWGEGGQVSRYCVSTS
jgi:hypothetical protein